MLQHGDEHTLPTVGDSAQGAAVRMTFGTKLSVVGSTSWVANDADACPVVENVAQAFVAAMAHEHDGLLTALPRDERCARVAPQPMIISICDSL